MEALNARQGDYFSVLCICQPGSTLAWKVDEKVIDGFQASDLTVERKLATFPA